MRPAASRTEGSSGWTETGGGCGWALGSRCAGTASCRIPATLFFFSSRRRHTRFDCDWSSDVCSSDLTIFRVPTCMLEVHVSSRVLRSPTREDITPLTFIAPHKPRQDCATRIHVRLLGDRKSVV